MGGVNLGEVGEENERIGDSEQKPIKRIGDFEHICKKRMGDSEHLWYNSIGNNVFSMI